jgi:hypothetical protein
MTEQDGEHKRWPGKKCSYSFHVRFRAKSEQLKYFKGLLPYSQGQNLALSVAIFWH